MLQKEVVVRLTAPPGGKEYGALSAMTQCYFDLRREIVVKRTAFYPPPEVDSAVISLSPKARPAIGVDKQAEFRKLLQAAFAHRRKKLENSLGDAGLVEGKSQGEELLDRAGIGLGRRAESLSLEEFARLFHSWETRRENELN
jgi:16S rRNA (adenine1518-N6/adenine1519-N6)-dimethyltransferase